MAKIMPWQFDTVDEANALKHLLLHLGPMNMEGFTVYPGLHIIRQSYCNNTALRYNIVVYMSEIGDFLPPTETAFHKVRAELYRSAMETDPNIVGPLLSLCNTCLQPTKLKCARCRMAYYCDRQCQKDDYKLHRHFCTGENTNLSLFFAFDLGEG